MSTEGSTQFSASSTATLGFCVGPGHGVVKVDVGDEVVVLGIHGCEYSVEDDSDDWDESVLEDEYEDEDEVGDKDCVEVGGSTGTTETICSTTVVGTTLDGEAPAEIEEVEAWLSVSTLTTWILGFVDGEMSGAA